jgi:copper(I)-binding protein
MMTRMRILAALLIVFASVTSAVSHSYQVKGLMIGHVWAQPVPAGDAGRLFMPIYNQGTERDVLIGVDTPVAEKAELWLVDEGAKRADRIAIDPKVVLSMRPGGRFIKLVGLRQPLAAGHKFRVTLTFQSAGPIEIEAWVEEKPYGR